MIASSRLLQRWVQASIAKHLHAAATEVNLQLVVEFLDTRSTEFKNAAIKAEATISGPSVRLLSPGFRRVQTSVVVIVTSIPAIDTAAYSHMDACGRIQEALDQCVVVRKYAENEPSPEEVGVVEPRNDQPVAVSAVHIKPSVSDQTLHSVLEGLYVGYFK